ncbi:helix-turn-helix transcriptional regulator [Neobacillus sp. MM2021_6]|uniref:helix-turn-helix domain-containing protein n=1 Tax=Bacillaceae TaxID=186817 RepID=UPI00140BE996|nr:MULTISPECIES: helix-turn-helix transcriptional regulator [Bacillaceae]MBO0960876.1 helix-turn-helix transcriptional regulator [Neobacillus sp. MM2021_6]NHC21164.1 helix-turn-helix transcriptional regulator [Bacillus sp. MM2020_4]
MYGATMKSIRKQKGLSQKELYTGVVSKSFYSDFEADKYSVSVDKFHGLLQNLNISFEEFLYFYNQMDLSDTQKLEKKIDDYYKQGKFEELFSIYQEYYTSSIREVRYLASKAYLLVLITNSNFYNFSRDPLNEIISNLEITKSWTLNEIKLAKLVLLSIPEKKMGESFKLYNKISEELSKYMNFSDLVYQKELADLYFNRIQSLLVLNNISEAEKVFQDYSNLMNGIDDLHLFIQFHFIKILLGLYLDYFVSKEEIDSFLGKIDNVPVSECHFYKIIFQIHNEKAKSYFLRYQK